MSYLLEVVLGILAVFLSSAAMIYIFYRFAMAAEKRKAESRGKAIPAEATVREITEGSGRLNKMKRRYSRITLQLTVHSQPEGDRMATAEWWVDAEFIPQVQPGAKIPVKVDMEVPSRIYPASEWAGEGIVDFFTAR